MKKSAELQPDAYPLAWPAGQPRTPEEKRTRANFHGHTVHASTYKDSEGHERVSTHKRSRPLTVAEALRRLKEELRRLDAVNITISTNVELRGDGEPWSGRKEPVDPGVAVYFALRENGALMPVCFPCDAFTRVPDNLAAVAGHIAALRAQERYKVGTRAQVYAGFKALPAKGETGDGAAVGWRAVLGFDEKWPRPPHTAEATKVHLSLVDSRYREQLRQLQQHDPEGLTTHERRVALNLARRDAEQELKGSA